MAFFFFIWDDDMLEKLAIREISMEDVEEIISHPDEVTTSRSSGRPAAIGFTAAGRRLLCVYEQIDDETVQPVSAFEIE